MSVRIRPLPLLLSASLALGCTHVVQDAPPEADTTNDSQASPTESTASACSIDELDMSHITDGLESPFRADYVGSGDGGLTHTTYFTLAASEQDPVYAALAGPEKQKVPKAQEAAALVASAFVPSIEQPGTEVTGTLVAQDAHGERRQEIVLKIPERWNGKLVVAGTPGVRSELSSDAILAPWLLARGYAYVSGNKGLTNAGAQAADTMMSGEHPTQHWGRMMLDLAGWAQHRLREAAGRPVARTYAVGLSNGGYQVRRALELDHERVGAAGSKRPFWKRRLFDGGLDWGSPYWPDAAVLDINHDGQVSPSELASSLNFMTSMDRATLAMRYADDPDSVTTPEAFAQDPPFSEAQSGMATAGFTPESALFWGHHNALYDYLKSYGFPHFRGVGYYNYTTYLYRAELRGDSALASMAYSCFPANDTDPPPLYAWLQGAVDGGWTQASVGWALANANTGVFSVPMISVHGERDALVGLQAHALAYRRAVEQSGNPDLHRLYVIQNGNHVDAYADGIGDFDFDGVWGEEGIASLTTPVQPYVERAFEYLERWVERRRLPPKSKRVDTDPANDVLDASSLSW